MARRGLPGVARAAREAARGLRDQCGDRAARGYFSVANDDRAEAASDSRRRSSGQTGARHPALERARRRRLPPGAARPAAAPGRQAGQVRDAERGRMALDVHPATRPRLGDPSRPLVVTEGVRKADAALSQGVDAIALLGVWNWRGSNGDSGKTALARLGTVALDGRAVYLVFDSDATSEAAGARRDAPGWAASSSRAARSCA